MGTERNRTKIMSDTLTGGKTSKQKKANPAAAAASGGKRKSHDDPPPVPDDMLHRLMRLEHHDPHAVLGAHVVPGGVVVRAFRVDAATVTLLPDDGDPIAMQKVHDAGLFQAWLPGWTQTFAYRLQIQWPD